MNEFIDLYMNDMGFFMATNIMLGFSGFFFLCAIVAFITGNYTKE